MMSSENGITHSRHHAARMVIPYELAAAVMRAMVSAEGLAFGGSVVPSASINSAIS